MRALHRGGSVAAGHRRRRRCASAPHSRPPQRAAAQRRPREPQPVTPSRSRPPSTISASLDFPIRTDRGARPSGAPTATDAVPALTRGGQPAHATVRAVPRARAAVRLQRSAHARCDGAGARRRNDRLRAVAYAYFEHNPEPAVVAAAARGARRSESSEFVRPALMRALAAYGDRSEGAGRRWAGRDAAARTSSAAR